MSTRKDWRTDPLARIASHSASGPQSMLPSVRTSGITAWRRYQAKHAAISVINQVLILLHVEWIKSDAKTSVNEDLESTYQQTRSQDIKKHATRAKSFRNNAGCTIHTGFSAISRCTYSASRGSRIVCRPSSPNSTVTSTRPARLRDED